MSVYQEMKGELITLNQQFDKFAENINKLMRITIKQNGNLIEHTKKLKAVGHATKVVAEKTKEVSKASEKAEKGQRGLAKMYTKNADGTRQYSNMFGMLYDKLTSTDEQVKLYEQMSDIRAQMVKIDDTKIEEPSKNKKPAKTPPLAADWVKENSQWFNKPGYRKETAMAYGIDAELTEEGWDVNDPDYYTEMDKRLKESKLPFFVKDEESSSQSSKNVVQKNNRVQSPVAGVSRKKVTDSNRVKLTSDDLDTARNFGIDINDEAALKRFAKEVKNFSTNT